MTTCSSILAWRIPWTGEPSGLQSMGSEESDMTERLETERESSFCHQDRLRMHDTFQPKIK